MTVLALDTTTRAGSVALVADEKILIERAGDGSRTHAERLPTEILALVRDAGATLNDVDVFAIAAGPGSFTGLRIGIATMQGLAFVERRPIAAISALEALAQIASTDVDQGALVGAWMDAYRHDVFSALYKVAGGPAFSAARLTEIDPAAVASPADTLQRWREFGATSVFVGDGAAAYVGVIGDRGRVVPTPLLAGAIGRMALDRARRGETIDPAAVQPLYVRRPDAETARDLKNATN
jgi:tRNA threonylcarbamoyladenosine biosynthesis protein TsaB